MSFLFLSHASADKPRLRPLVEVMVQEGETIWLDRPGAGAGNFGFDQSYIDANDIDYLHSGQPWSSSIKGALHASGAVLGCLSRALLNEVAVLKDELLFADTARKLVTCIVDDLSHSELATIEGGLLDLTKYQAPHIDCDRLASGLVARSARGLSADGLPSELRAEWEKIRNLLADVDRVRTEPRPMRSKDIDPAAAQLIRIPVGPPLHVRHIPREIIDALSTAIDTPGRIHAVFDQASTLVTAAFPTGYTERQILLRRSQLPPFGTMPSEAFWTQVLAAAGLKARRTLAAFLLTPMGRWALARAGVTERAQAFLANLEQPHALSDV